MLQVPDLENPREIGRGGFGVVYLADDRELGRQVAVKVLHERLDDESVRRAFVRECRAMGALSGHPHIVTVHSSGQTPHGEPYIEMAYLSGGSLADRLAAGPLPWPQVVEIGIKLAGALETAHRRGILHLDLKPANVLVSEYGEPALGDFGIARFVGTDPTNTLRLSPAYAAPERLDGSGEASVQADLYSLGATLFALVAGEPAFGGTPDPVAHVARVLLTPVPDLRPQVPPEFCAVIERLMAKRPQERHPDALAVVRELQAVQRARGQVVTREVVEGSAAGPAPTPAAPVPMLPPVRPAGPPHAPAPAPRTPIPPAPAPRAPTPRAPTRPAPAPPASTAPLLGGPVPAGRPDPPPPRPGPPTVLAAGPPVRRRRRLVLVAAAVLALAVVGTVGLARVPGWDDTTVRLADGVAHPAAEQVRDRFAGLFTAVNEHRYAEAFAFYDADSGVARAGLDAYERSQRSSTILDPEIASVTGVADGLDVLVRFRSTQLAELSPDGRSTCTRWGLTYRLVRPAGAWVIRSAAHTAGSPQPC